MFLIVNSSMIVVISGRRATLWGSVYLDEHGEEDRELKYGKSVFSSTISLAPTNAKSTIILVNAFIKSRS